MEDRAANLYRAVAEISRFGPILELSRIYESAPLYDRAQNPFLNACAAIRTQLSPEELLHAVKEVEANLGRRKDPARPKGPRVVDIDILLYGARILDNGCPDLTIPHPGLLERGFVLRPLLEIAPGVADPRDGTVLANALETVTDQVVYLYRGKPLYYPRSDDGDDC